MDGCAATPVAFRIRAGSPASGGGTTTRTLRRSHAAARLNPPVDKRHYPGGHRDRGDRRRTRLQARSRHRRRLQHAAAHRDRNVPPSDTLTLPVRHPCRSHWRSPQTWGCSGGRARAVQVCAQLPALVGAPDRTAPPVMSGADQAEVHVQAQDHATDVDRLGLTVAHRLIQDADVPQHRVSLP